MAKQRYVKECPSCGLLGGPSLAKDFYRNKSRKDGFHANCKKCMNASHMRRDHSRRVRTKRVWPTDKFSISDRLKFYSKLNSKTGCLEWTGATNRRYGVFRFDGRVIFAHRASFEENRSAIPAGMCVCHHCDNPPCINPDHLFLGTQSDNIADMVRKGRHKSMRAT